MTPDERSLLKAAQSHIPELGRNAVRYVGLLLEKGTSPDVTDESGTTALQHTAKRNNVTIARQLLDYGANPCLTDMEGRAASDWARAGGFTALEEILKQAERQWQGHTSGLQSCQRRSGSRSKPTLPDH